MFDHVKFGVRDFAASKASAAINEAAAAERIEAEVSLSRRVKLRVPVRP